MTCRLVKGTSRQVAGDQRCHTIADSANMPFYPPQGAPEPRLRQATGDNLICTSHRSQPKRPHPTQTTHKYDSPSRKPGLIVSCTFNQRTTMPSHKHRFRSRRHVPRYPNRDCDIDAVDSLVRSDAAPEALEFARGHWCWG